MLIWLVSALASAVRRYTARSTAEVSGLCSTTGFRTVVDLYSQQGEVHVFPGAGPGVHAQVLTGAASTGAASVLR